MASGASPLFQCVRSDAPPRLISLYSTSIPRAAARRAISPGRSLRAVKLLPMNRTFSRVCRFAGMACTLGLVVGAPASRLPNGRGKRYAIDGGFELGQVYGLGQVLRKPGVAAGGDVG